MIDYSTYHIQDATHHPMYIAERELQRYQHNDKCTVILFAWPIAASMLAR